MKPFSGKVSQAKRSTLLKSRFGHKKLVRKWFWSYPELKKECSEHLKRLFFSILWVFHWQSWNHFWEKVRQSVQSYLNQHLVIGRFLENDFGATLRSKTSVVSVWKAHCSVFWRFLSDKFGTILWESEGKRSRLFKSDFRYRKLVRKWFWSYLEFKSGCSERLKRAFLRFFKNFWVTTLKPFAEKLRQGFQNYLNRSLVIQSFLENGFEATLSSKTNVVSVWKEHCSVFCKFLIDEVETIFWGR